MLFLQTFIYYNHLIEHIKRGLLEVKKMVAQESAFRGMIEFLGKLGVYDVILPFLLVFTIVFAIFEKTKILGTVKINGQVVGKKNLNSMVAFIMAFLVIASTQLVALISTVMANVVLLLILAISFMLLVGTFFGDSEFTLKDYPGWTKFFMIFMFIGIVLIFLHALNWLDALFKLLDGVGTDWVSGAVFFAILIFFMWFITTDQTIGKKKD